MTEYEQSKLFTMKQIYILVIALSLTLVKVSAQSTEDFESETPDATSFNDNGQSFTITSGSNDTYTIINHSGGGWNGTSIDNRFIDNTMNIDNTGDGTSLKIITTDGTYITLKSFYLFVSNSDLSGPGTPTTITIEGKKDGNNVFTLTKNSGIVDGSTFTPNNGYTFIDFTTEGGVDNSNKNIDEIIITSTGNADYFSLDAFTWDNQVLSINDFENQKIKTKIFPNPSTNFIQISGLLKKEYYTIYNILGSEIKNGILTNNEKIYIKDFTNGLYFLKFDNGNTIKFIKE